jgi:hypothetical protein
MVHGRQQYQRKRCGREVVRNKIQPARNIAAEEGMP